MFNEDQKVEIAKRIFNRLGGSYKCPMCGNSQFSIVEDFGFHVITLTPLKNIAPPSFGIPYIMLMCRRCGFMSSHNAITLGILDIDTVRDMINKIEGNPTK